ncbi:MAG TPA: hypothetical protein ENH95_02895 [Nitrosopumilus sp.]|nr:hypothetical protein [Nitrosopumilus sp.]
MTKSNARVKRSPKEIKERLSAMKVLLRQSMKELKELEEDVDKVTEIRIWTEVGLSSGWISALIWLKGKKGGE